MFILTEFNWSTNVSPGEGLFFMNSKKAFLTQLLLMFTVSAASPAMASTSWKSLIAEDPRQLTLQEDMIAEGDLNGDGIRDAAAVATFKDSAGDEGETPILFVFFGKRDGTYVKHTETAKAVCAGCGGMKGSPFLGEPSVNAKGQLVLSYMGGSREVWSEDMKFRYNAKSEQFDAIGYSYMTFDSAVENGAVAANEVQDFDANLITGKMYRTLGSGKKQSCRVSPKWQGITLAQFDYLQSGNLYGDLAIVKTCVRRK
jgi:hypothetical protein